MLFYLALTQRAHSREALAGLLWSESSEEEARLSLRVALNGLRQHFSIYLIASRLEIAFDRNQPHSIDVAVFDEALRAGPDQRSTRELAEALASYRGDFLQDFHVKDAPLFEEWVILERERLRLQALNVMQALITRYQEQQQYEQAITLAQRALAIDPWREEAHRQLMTLLAQSRRRSEALKQYETCRQILLEELGVEPAPDTRALYERIRSGALPGLPEPPGPEARAVPQHNLPALATAFIGREAELAQLHAMLSQDDCRLVTLVGPGGVGKSRLALELGRQCFTAPWACDGVLYVSLAGIESGEFFSTELLNALGVALSGEDPKQALLQHLRDRRLLFILDNFEQLVASGVLLTEIIHAGPHVRLIVTSREAIQLSEEWIFEVNGLTLPLAPETIQTSDAVKLFVQRARRVNLAFSLAEELAAVVQICRLVEGLPLAIELAASRVRVMSCAAIAKTIGESLDSLTSLYRDMPARHRSMRATFEQSWRLLSQHEQQALSRLAVFRGGFQVEAAQRIAAAPLTILTALNDKSLVRRAAADRFEIHELLRQYVGEKLEEAGRGQLARNDHLQYFLELAESAEPELRAAGQTTWLECLDREQDNLRAALDWAILSQQADLAGRLAGTLSLFWRLIGNFNEGRHWTDVVLALPGAMSTATREKLLGGAGALALRQTDLASAEKLMAESLELARELAAPEKISRRLQGLACVATNLGEYARASQLIHEGLEIDQGLGDFEGIAFDWDALGDIAFRQRDYAQARVYWENSLSLHRQRQDKASTAISLNNLGEVAMHLGDYPSASSSLEESLALFREMGDQQMSALVLTNLGQIHTQLGHIPSALSMYKEVLQLQVSVNTQADIALTLESMAGLMLQIGDPARTVRLCAASAVLREKCGMTPTPVQSTDLQSHLTAARDRLGETAYQEAWQAGRTLSIEQAIALANSIDGTALTAS